MTDLNTHRAHLNTIKAQRRLLDVNFARVVAEAVRDGHDVNDLLSDVPDANQQVFDL